MHIGWFLTFHSYSIRITELLKQPNLTPSLCPYFSSGVAVGGDAGVWRLDGRTVPDVTAALSLGKRRRRGLRAHCGRQKIPARGQH